MLEKHVNYNKSTQKQKQAISNHDILIKRENRHTCCIQTNKKTMQTKDSYYHSVIIHVCTVQNISESKFNHLAWT